MFTKLSGLIAGTALFLTAAPAGAHHAFAAEFDGTKPVRLEGTLTKIELINPHSWFHVNVKEPDGKMTEWMVEGGSPNALVRLGVTKDSVKVGSAIVATGYQAKDGSNKACGTDFTFADGRRMFLGTSNPNAPGATQ